MSNPTIRFSVSSRNAAIFAPHRDKNNAERLSIMEKKTTFASAIAVISIVMVALCTSGLFD